MTLCSELKKEYTELEKLKVEFESAFDAAVKTGKTEEAQKLKIQIEEKLSKLKEKIVPKEIKAIFTNPETNEQKEIIFNIQEKIQEWQEFNQKHDLPILNEQEIKKIFQKNKAEIQKEMETYGYDNILMIPENLPNTEQLNQKMTKGYKETWQSSNFKEGGSFTGSKHTENQKTKIILCHNDQNIYDNPEANVFEKATLRKNILQLSGLTEQEIQQKIQNQENIPVNFETSINGKTVKVQAEGLSLNEYLIFQKQYQEKNRKHLDESGWTWLLKTFSASRVVDSGWDSDSERLDVGASDSGSSYGHLSCRLSRSFEN